MSVPTVADRHVWAAAVLAPAPDARVLEVGCGAGLTAALVCAALRSGTYTGVDRSAPMVAQAERRNADQVARGTAAFVCGGLADADLGARRFDLAFGMNVSAFFRDPPSVVEPIRGHLVPDGVLHVLYQAPSRARTERAADGVVAALSGLGFSVAQVRWADLAAGRAVAVSATPA